MRRILFLIISLLVIIGIITLVMAAQPKKYQLTDVSQDNSTSRSILTGGIVTIYCRAYQPYSGTQVGDATCNHYMQWNSSTQAWTDIPTSPNTVWVSTNPTQWSLGTVQANTWNNLTAYAVNFTVAGNYSIRCREPAETCSNSVALTSSTSLVVTVTDPSADTCTCAGNGNNWEINIGDACNIETTCDLGAGNITFTGTGTTTFNAVINAANLEYPVTDQTLMIGSNAIITIG